MIILKQAASHQLLEAKKRAAKVIAMKKAAREACPEKEMTQLRTKPMSMTVHEGDDHTSRQHTLTTQDFHTSKHTTDAAATKQSSPSHFWRSWQRGSLSLSKEQGLLPGQHFPSLPKPTTPPLSFDMMRPLPIFHTVGQNPTAADWYWSNEEDYQMLLQGEGGAAPQPTVEEEPTKKRLILQMTK